MTGTYFIESLEVEGLWGRRDYDLKFNSEVNIIIGPNASGKTTLLKLLNMTFTGDFEALREIQFDRFTVHLKSFDGKSHRTVTVASTDSGFTCTVSRRQFDIDLSTDYAFLRRYGSLSGSLGNLSEGLLPSLYRRRASPGQLEASEQLQSLVTIVWLPVSRRLPIPESDLAATAEVERQIKLDSVDERLRELVDQLAKYRIGLDAQMSERYKEFERRALGLVLFDERFDTFGPVKIEDLPSETDKQLLLRAFEEAGLLDSKMRHRIEHHFSVATETLKRIGKLGTDRQDIDDFVRKNLFIIPLVPRTKEMVKAAQNLEERRLEIFETLRDYEKIVNSFFEDKDVSVLDKGELRIHWFPDQRGDGNRLEPDHLSSGEKQMLILLTQALLREDRPMVYLADEPELSLHVEWQEKLLESLGRLGKKTQLIVATHSPDIVGPFTDNVANLAQQY